jgi:hypothetical protein
VSVNTRKVEPLTNGTAERSPKIHTIRRADVFEDILKASDGPMSLEELEKAANAKGRSYSKRDVISLYLREDQRFVRPERGKWDLVQRELIQ